MRADVVALFVDSLGPYPKLLAPGHWYDESRDARTYAGPWPVVAHPPCGAWSLMRHLSHGAGKDCGPIAVEQVRRWGGVLEQPAHSKLWAACDIGWTDRDDAFGFSIEVEQVAWGHVARKKTWLYLVGIESQFARSGVRRGGTVTHWCSGGRTKRPGMGATVPPGIKVCCAQQRRRTPLAFAEWLLSLAATAQHRARKGAA